MAKHKVKKPKNTPAWITWGAGIILVLMLVSMIPTGNTGATSATFIPGIDNDAMKGDPYAPVTIIAFSDYECSYCKTGDQTINLVLSEYAGKVNYVFRDLPLSELHPYAQKAAEAAECAGAQGKFWEMHDAIFANETDLGVNTLKKRAIDLGLNTTSFNECLDTGAMAAEVKADQAEGLKAGVDGVPTFFVNGRKLKGAQSLEAFTAIIDEELAKVR